MALNRREFLTTTLASTAGAMLATTLPAAPAPARAAGNNPFQLVPLNKTGLKVSLIGAGTGMRGGNRQSNMTRMGKEKFSALLKYEFDKGVRFFDLADLYGTHPFFADAMQGVPRDQYVISTKIWMNKGGIPEAERPDANIVIDRFRKELKTDYIDLIQIHCMTDPKWTDTMKRQMDLLAELKAKGVIKGHGVSVHSLAALQACATSPWVDSVHVRINPFGVSMGDKDPAADKKPEPVAQAVKQLREAGKGIVGMKIIGEGAFRKDPARIDQSIQYALGLVDMMIVGFEKPEEVDDFAGRVQAALAKRQG